MNISFKTRKIVPLISVFLSVLTFAGLTAKLSGLIAHAEINKQESVLTGSDDSLRTANNLGTISTTTLSNSIGMSDKVDYYRFQLEENSNVEIQIIIQGTSSSARIALINDVNGNEVIDGQDFRLGSRSVTGAIISEPLPANTYFVEVISNSRVADFEYDLIIIVDEQPKSPNLEFEPGESLDTAIDIGNLVGTYQVTDYAGLFDRQDYYKFSLEKNSNLQVSFTPLSDVRFNISLISDVNRNFLIDEADETIQPRPSLGSERNMIVSLARGTYFLGIEYSGRDEGSQYNLTLIAE